MKRLFAASAMAAMVMAGSAFGNEELKMNMYKLNNHMIQMQAAFIEGDKDKALRATKVLEEEAKKLFGKESDIKQMLPEDKRFKSRIAITSAAMIQNSIDVIKDSMDNTRRDTAQNAYLDIQRACMRCHNLVRDW